MILKNKKTKNKINTQATFNHVLLLGSVFLSIPFAQGMEKSKELTFISMDLSDIKNKTPQKRQPDDTEHDQISKNQKTIHQPSNELHSYNTTPTWFQPIIPSLNDNAQKLQFSHSQNKPQNQQTKTIIDLSQNTKLIPDFNTGKISQISDDSVATWTKNIQNTQQKISDIKGIVIGTLITLINSPNLCGKKSLEDIKYNASGIITFDPKFQKTPSFIQNYKSINDILNLINKVGDADIFKISENYGQKGSSILFYIHLSYLTDMILTNTKDLPHILEGERTSKIRRISDGFSITLRALADPLILTNPLLSKMSNLLSQQDDLSHTQYKKHMLQAIEEIQHTIKFIDNKYTLFIAPSWISRTTNSKIQEKSTGNSHINMNSPETRTNNNATNNNLKFDHLSIDTNTRNTQQKISDIKATINESIEFLLKCNTFSAGPLIKNLQRSGASIVTRTSAYQSTPNYVQNADTINSILKFINETLSVEIISWSEKYGKKNSTIVFYDHLSILMDRILINKKDTTNILVIENEIYSTTNAKYWSQFQESAEKTRDQVGVTKVLLSTISNLLSAHNHYKEKILLIIEEIQSAIVTIESKINLFLNSHASNNKFVQSTIAEKKTNSFTHLANSTTQEKRIENSQLTPEMTQNKNINQFYNMGTTLPSSIQFLPLENMTPVSDDMALRLEYANNIVSQLQNTMNQISNTNSQINDSRKTFESIATPNTQQLTPEISPNKNINQFFFEELEKSTSEEDICDRYLNF